MSRHTERSVAAPTESDVRRTQVPPDYVTFLVSLGFLAVCGIILDRLAGRLGLTDGPSIRSDLLYGSGVFLKNRDAFLFLTLTLLGLPIIGSSFALLTFLSRRRLVRFTPPHRAIGDAVAAMVFALALLSLLFGEPYFAFALERGTSLPVPIVLIVAAAALATSYGFFPGALRRSCAPVQTMRFARVCRFAAFAGVVALTVFVAASSRVVRLEMFTDATAYTTDFEIPVFGIGQMSAGGRCLVDVMNQYGCFGLFLSPIIDLFGHSVLVAAVAFTALYVAALFSVYAFVRRTIENTLVAVTCCLFVLAAQAQNVMFGVDDPYFQYWPVRTLCPALSLLVITFWPQKRSYLLAFCAGIFGASSVLWNVDSGVVVLVSIAIYRLAVTLSCREGKRWDTVFELASYGGGALATLLGYVSWATSGSVSRFAATFANITYYQKLFVSAGIASMATPSIPALWCGALALAGLLFVISCREVARGRACPASYSGFYLALLAVGLFQYYTGRSHVLVLAEVSWPFFIIAFILLDRALRERVSGEPSRFVVTRRAFFRTLAALSAVSVICMFLSQLPALTTELQTRWFAETPLGPKLRSDVSYIERLTPGERDVGVLDVYGGSLLLESGKRFASAPRDLAEMYRESDYDTFLTRLVEHGPSDVFIGADLLSDSTPNAVGLKLLEGGLEKIKSAYVLTGGNDTGQLMHFRRAGEQPSVVTTSVSEAPRGTLPDYGDRSFHAVFVPRLGLFIDQSDVPHPAHFTLDRPLGAPGFTVDLRVKPVAGQAALATILSNHCCYHGIVIEYLGIPGHYRFGIGSGSTWVIVPFEIPDGRESRVFVAYEVATKRLLFAIDGTKIYDRRGVNYALSTLPFAVGSFSMGGRTFDGVRELSYYARFVEP